MFAILSLLFSVGLIFFMMIALLASDNMVDTEVSSEYFQAFLLVFFGVGGLIFVFFTVVFVGDFFATRHEIKKQQKVTLDWKGHLYLALEEAMSASTDQSLLRRLEKDSDSTRVSVIENRAIRGLGAKLRGVQSFDVDGTESLIGFRREVLRNRAWFEDHVDKKVLAIFIDELEIVPDSYEKALKQEKPGSSGTIQLPAFLADA